MKKKMRRILSVLLALCMILDYVPMTARAEGDEGTVVTTWAQLQEAFNAGGDVTLGADVTPGPGDVALSVPKDKVVNLYLNNHVIDRALTEPTQDGSVIIVRGFIDINGPGVITGGNTTGTGGGIWVRKDGAAGLSDGAIVTGNYARNAGGGVYVSGSSSQFFMTGGTITGNSSKNGGGVGLSGTGDMYMFSGSITSNTATNNGGGIWYGGDSTTTLQIYDDVITGNAAGVCGGGLYVNGGKFIICDGVISGNSAPKSSEIGAKDPGSLPTYTVTIDENIDYGTVTADKLNPALAETVTLTATPEEGYILKSLTVTDADNDPVTVTNNAFTMPKSNVTVSATFEEVQTYYIDWDDVSGGRVISPDRADAGSTVTVTIEPDSSSHVTASLTARMEDEWHQYVQEIPGISHPDPNTIVFTMPSANVEIEATFGGYGEKRVFICDAVGGKILADKNVAVDGETVTLTIQPDNGYAYDPESLQVTELDTNSNQEMELPEGINQIEENRIYSFDAWQQASDVYFCVRASFTKVPEQPKYYVLVDDEIEDGTLTADLDLASEGWTVTLTAAPDTERGFALRTLTVLDTNGDPIATTPIGNNQYTFVMPAGHVTASAEFSVPVNEITVVTQDVDVPAGRTTGCEIDADSEAQTGDSVTVLVRLRPETEVAGLSVTGNETGNPCSITLASHNEGSSVYFYRFTMPDESVTVTGQFTIPKRGISTESSLKGALSLSVGGESQSAPCTAAVGETVEITYEAPEYHYLKKLQLQYLHNGSPVTINRTFTDQGDGTYVSSFEMPDSDVTILLDVPMDPVDYLDASGTLCTLTSDYKVLTSSMISWTEGWYVVKNNVTISDRIMVNASDVHLILCDGVTLNARKGISVDGGRGLTIYAQSDDNDCGVLNAGPNDGSKAAGIGGNNTRCGTIVINGGRITAEGSNLGAGIGCGNVYAMDGDSVTINGGVITAKTKDGRFFGIFADTVTLNGGIITSDGYDQTNHLTLSRNFKDLLTGTVYEAMTSQTPSDYLRYNRTSFIPADTYVIHKDVDEIYVDCGVSTNREFAKAGDVISLTCTSSEWYAFESWEVTDSNNNEITVVNNSFTMPAADVTIRATFSLPESVSYVEADGITEHEITEFQMVRSNLTNWEDGAWYVAAGNVKVNESINVNGRVNLILCDGATMTALQGIKVSTDNTLVIWQQSGGTGALVATGAFRGAGIGGISSKCGTVEINGGTITASGGGGGAGIGGGNGPGGTVIINNGNVTATGGTYSAGIGGGSQNPAGGTVMINGGHVVASIIGYAGISTGATTILISYPDGELPDMSVRAGSYNGSVRFDKGFEDENGNLFIGNVSNKGALSNKTLTPCQTFSVTYAGGKDDETVSGGVVKGGVTLTLPACNLTIPTGKVFGEWSVVIGDAAPVTKNPGDEITVTADVVAMAVWEDAIYEISGAGTTPGEETNGEWIAKVDGSIATRALYGETVTLIALPNDGYLLAENGFTVKWQDGEYNEHDVELTQDEIDKNKYTFVMPEHNVTVTALFEEAILSEHVLRIKSARVFFDGQIQLGFKFMIPAALLTETDACVTFESNGKTVKTQLISTGKNVAEGEYEFYYPVMAPEFADAVTIKAYDGTGAQIKMVSDSNETEYKTRGISLSVKQYAEYMKEHATDSNMRNLAKALLGYCTAAQIYFKYGEYEDLVIDEAVGALTLDGFSGYELTTDGTRPDGISGASIQTFFESDNTLRINFVLDGTKPIKDYVFQLDGKVVTPKLGSGSTYYLQVRNVAAPNLDVAHTFIVTCGDAEYTVYASVLSYARMMAQSGKDDSRNLGKALLLYCQAANAYFEN